MVHILPIKESTLISSLVALKVVIDLLVDGNEEKAQALAAIADLERLIAHLGDVDARMASHVAPT